MTGRPSSNEIFFLADFIAEQNILAFAFGDTCDTRCDNIVPSSDGFLGEP